MGQDLRFKIEHMGDSFVSLLEKIPAVAKESLGFLKKVPDAASGSLNAFKKIPDIAKDPLKLLQKVPDAARSSARGVILTYDIHEYGNKKEKLVAQIGSLFVAFRKEGREKAILKDETMNALLSELDEIESKLSAYTIERTERLYPSEKTEETSAQEEQETAAEGPLNQESVETAHEETAVEETAEGKSSSEDTTEEDEDPRFL